MTADDHDNAKASLEVIKAEKFSKKRQRKEKKAQTSFNHLKRLRDEALARLALISKQVGRYEEMFCKDPQGRMENRDQNIFKESKEAKNWGYSCARGGRMEACTRGKTKEKDEGS